MNIDHGQGAAWSRWIENIDSNTGIIQDCLTSEPTSDSVGAVTQPEKGITESDLLGFRRRLNMLKHLLCAAAPEEKTARHLVN